MGNFSMSQFDEPIRILSDLHLAHPGSRVVDARQTFLGLWVRLLIEGRDQSAIDLHADRIAEALQAEIGEG